MVHEEITKEIIVTLDKSVNYGSDVKRSTDDNDVINRLSVNVKDEINEHSITKFLTQYCFNEIKCYLDIYNSIPLKEGLNPHKPNQYEYNFAETIDGRPFRHVAELKDLLTPNPEKINPEKPGEYLLNLFDKKNIIHFGKKGSGKTITQNAWLHKNNKLFEDEDIFWVRLDVSKLEELWENESQITRENGLSVTTEEYVLGQIVYVFCKHFLEKFAIKENTQGELTGSGYSTLFGRIAKKLSQSPDYNNISHIELTKRENRLVGSDRVSLRKYATEKDINTIIEYLILFEKYVAIDEGTYKDEEERYPSFEKTNPRKSYLVDHVLLKNSDGSKTKSFIEWITIGDILRDFMLKNGFHILYIVDGIDNVSFFKTDKKEYMKKLLEQLYNFPLHASNSRNSEKELLLMTLRPNTYQELKKEYIKKVSQPQNTSKDIEQFVPIYQETIVQKDKHFFAKPIRINKVNSFFEQHSEYKNTYIKQVLDVMNNDTADTLLDKDIWNDSFRCMLFNSINLAKYITFQYYLFGKNSKEKFIIKNQLKTFEKINLLLNGNLFVWEKQYEPIGNRGFACFNLFGYVNENGEYDYFIYTHLLLLINVKNQIGRSKLEKVICLFERSSTICEPCIDRLISSGMIDHLYSKEKNEMLYEITPKGKFFLSEFYNDIHYLYYSSLDTMLPIDLVDDLKISPNNKAYYEENRNYPPYCIITGTLFLQYLMCKHKIILSSEDLKKNLNKEGINISVFELPIKKDEALFESIIDMVHKCSEDQIKILNEWLQDLNKRQNDTTDSNLFKRQEKPTLIPENKNIKKKIFISYSKYDKTEMHEFLKHTVALQEQNLIEKPWEDEWLAFNKEWNEEIKLHIKECDIMVCLISVDFLNTNYIRKVEIIEAMKQNKILVPIIIKPCDWENCDIAKYQVALKGKCVSLNNKKYVTQESTDVEKASFWVEIIKEMRMKIFNDVE